MLILLNIFKLFFINFAFAAELNCASLFEESVNINDKINDHIVKVEQLIHGTAHHHAYFEISNYLQFRYFDVEERAELKMLGKHEIGIVNEDGLKKIKKFFQPQLLEIQNLENNKYLVHRWVVLQNVPVDFNSELIKADEVFIRSVLDQVVKNISLNHNPQHKAILFLDIDNLGVVNYFPGGHTTGDAYIKAVTEVVSENLRIEDRMRPGDVGDKDIGFKNYNGDEFFYLLDNISEGEIPKISKRIENALSNDPKINIIKIKAISKYETFKKFIKSLSDYSQLESFQDLTQYIQSSKTWKELSLEDQRNIQSSSLAFKKFISSYLKSAEVNEITNSINNISLGGSFGIEVIKTGDTLNNVLDRACLIMENCKILKKSNQKSFEKRNIYFPEL